MNNSFDVEQHSGCCAKVNKRFLPVCIMDVCECMYHKRIITINVCACVCFTVTHCCYAAGRCEGVLADRQHAGPVRAIWNFFTLFVYTALKHMPALWPANAHR